MTNRITLLLFLSVGLSQQEYDINHITEQNGVYIKKFSDEVVSGKVFQMFGDMKVPLGKMKDGKKEDKWMVWYDNGTKQKEQNYKDGKKNGLSILWFENGKKKIKQTYKDGKENGLRSEWYENGQKQYEGTIQNGNLNGLFTEWYDNGQKSHEGTFKDGKPDGLSILWFENGIKRKETQYLNDEKYGLETNYREEGGMYSQVDWIDRLNYTNTTFYEDGTIMSKGKFVNNKPYEGQFWSRDKFDGNFLDYRTTRKTYEKGKLIKIEWYGKLDTERRNVVRVDDCINTDDCLSEKEKKQKNTTSTEKKTIYEQKPFRVSYITHNYGDDIEVEFILNNMGNKSYSSVWFNFSFYNGDKMVGKERISFLSLGVFGEEIEIINFDDEFDKIEVELLKFKLK